MCERSRWCVHAQSTEHKFLPAPAPPKLTFPCALPPADPFAACTSCIRCSARDNFFGFTMPVPANICMCVWTERERETKRERDGERMGKKGGEKERETFRQIPILPPTHTAHNMHAHTHTPLPPPSPPPAEISSILFSAADILPAAPTEPAFLSSVFAASSGRAAAEAAAEEAPALVPAASPPAPPATGIGECGKSWRGRKSRVTLPHLT